jgi:hypothetical protein
MKQVNLFTSNLTGRALISEKSETKKAVKNALADFAKSIDSEFTKVIKSDDQRARNVANAAKGKFKTSLEVVANCYPYQTEDGVLCRKVKNADGVKVWDAKKLTASSARGIVRDALYNFTKFVGAPEITRVTIGAVVE